MVLHELRPFLSCFANTFIIKTDGSLWACGANTFGELGNGSSSKIPNSPTLKKVIISGVKCVEVGSGYIMAIKTNNSLWAWGYNFKGQLGDSTTTDCLVPKQIIASNIKDASSGYSHTIVLKSDGSFWAWGYNKYGQLGDGTTKDSSTPKQIFAAYNTK